MCIGGTSQWPATLFRGTDQWGERYGYLLVDPIGGAIGAFSTGDGINTGGQSRTPICKLPNVEHTEQTFPLLFLYRKEVVDSGGAGRWRGGMSAESCFIPHRTDSITHDTLSSGNATPTAPGIMGGYPGSVNVYKFRENTDIAERFERRSMPDDIAQVEGREVTLQLRQENFTQRPADVYAVIWSAAAGFGDPLEREPERVLEDVIANRAVSLEAARDIYGVVIKGEKLDVAGTKRLRERLRARRCRPAATVKRLTGKEIARATENVAVRRDAGKARYCCVKCSADLGLVRDNYKLACVREDHAIEQSNPNIGDWRRYIDDEPVFRQFFCPGCGSLIENEIARKGDDILQDIELHIR
jgi:N-methylhydantoinase B